MAVPGQRPGASEYSWGEGMFPNPAVDKSAPAMLAKLPPGETYAEVAAGGGDLEDQLRVMAAYKRINASGEGEVADPELAGNPDRFGPNPPLVRTPPKADFGPPDLEPVTKFERKW